jgi:hypothetical protein
MSEIIKKEGKIFISHSVRDKDLVNKFCDLILNNALGINLEAGIFNTSLDGSKPTSGEDFRDRIKSELVNSKAVLQFISNNYKNSEVCLNEMGASWVLSDNVIPLIIERGEFDVGFINSTTQQIQLWDRNQLLKFIDDHKGKFLPTSFTITRLNQKVEEFEKYYNEYIKREDNSEGIQSRVLDTNGDTYKPNQNDLFNIANREGLYIFYDNEFRLIQDQFTEFLLGLRVKQVRNISVEEINSYGKIGKAFPSILQLEIYRTQIGERYYVIMCDKKRCLPDYQNVSTFLRRRMGNVRLKMVEQSFLDGIEEEESLFKTKGKIE